MMETSLSAATEDRIAALEKKVREMEALVKGLTQELLDLKSVSMKMTKQDEERSRQELKRWYIVAGAPVQQAASPAMTPSSGARSSGPKVRVRLTTGSPGRTRDGMIMADDGTMKQNPARGPELHSCIRRVRKERRVQQQRASKSDLIYATEETKSES